MKKRRWIIKIGLAAALILFVGGLLMITSPKYRLSKLGYNDDEISTITDILDKAELSPILDNPYLPNLTAILTRQEAPADFRSENLENYIQADQKYDFAPELVVKLVNHEDYDSNEEYTETMCDIMYDEYYLTRNKTRYFTLAKDDSQNNLSPELIVARVNANRDRDYYTMTEPANLESSDLLLVNKYYYLDHDFDVSLVEQDAKYGSVGERMEVETYAAFEKMFAAAQAAGYQLYVTSGYRGYEEQEEVFASYLAEGDEAYALNYAAKPGFSEHQTGRAIDIFTPGETTKTFASSPVAKWLAENAYDYGFILRYPEGKEDLTGYNYEAWHYRYVGEAVAKEIRQRGITLEEYVAVFGNTN